MSKKTDHVTNIILGHALVILSLSGCVAARPLDNRLDCPCAPGWMCDDSVQLCKKIISPGTGGTTATGTGGAMGAAGGADASPGGHTVANDDAGVGGMGGTSGIGTCGPLVAPGNVSPGEVVDGCPCTRRPGMGNSSWCPPGANASISKSIGPEGGTIKLVSRQSASVPFSIDVPPGALAHAVTVKITETNLPPPSAFVDYSSVFHVEPDDLVLNQIASVQIPWSSNINQISNLGIYRNPVADECGFVRLGDSYTNAGFEMASLTRAGYFFVGAPTTVAPSTCP